MKKVKFKDVKDGQEFGCTPDAMLDINVRRVKTSRSITVNNAWADGTNLETSNIHPELEVYVYELPELAKGVYVMSKNDTNCWMFGLYDGIEYNRYRFLQAKNSGIFTINPKKWHFRQFMLK